MLKRAIIKYKTRLNIKKRMDTENKDFTTSSKIAVIYTVNTIKLEELLDIGQELKKTGKEVSYIALTTEKEAPGLTTPKFTTKDISFSGSLVSDPLTFFIKQKYDFMICLDNTGHYLIDYLCSLVKSDCRIGLYNPEKQRFFDLMVNISNEEETSISSEIFKYLKMIRTNGV